MEKRSLSLFGFSTFFILIINLVFISCEFSLVRTIGNGHNIILAFSTGAQHVTIVYGYNASSSLVKSIDMVNTSSFQSITLVTNLNLNVT